MTIADSCHVLLVSYLPVVKLPYLSVARFTGPDSGAFLQAQLSADIDALQAGASTLACYCSPRGQVIGLLLVCRRDDDFLVAAATSLLPAILQRLKMFVLRARVEFSAAAEFDVCGVYGEDSVSIAGEVFAPGPPGLSYCLAEACAAGKGGPAAWKVRELQCKLTWLGPETSEKYIPQMLGFDEIGAVSFSKGCYPGQEIVARAKYLGKVKRKPLSLVVENWPALAPGARLRLLRNGAWEDGTLLDSATAGGPQSLLLIVAPAEPNAAVEQLEYEGRSYRCATM